MILTLLLLTAGIATSIYFVDFRDNIALLKNNVALLNPFTDQNSTIKEQAPPPAPNVDSQQVLEGPETNTRHSPADKE